MDDDKEEERTMVTTTEKVENEITDENTVTKEKGTLAYGQRGADADETECAKERKVQRGH